MSSKRWILAAALAAMTALGCGRDRGDVSGRVTFQSQPVTEGEIVFSDPEYGTYYASPLDSKGEYTVVTKEGKGLWVGDYQVSIVPPRDDPPVGTSPPPRPKPFVVPQKYWSAQTSGLKASVASKNESFNFDLKP